MVVVLGTLVYFVVLVCLEFLNYAQSYILNCVTRLQTILRIVPSNCKFFY